MNILKSIQSIIIILLLVGGIIFIKNIYQGQQEIKKLLASATAQEMSKLSERPTEVLAAAPRECALPIARTCWSSLQSKVKDTVVQVFSQVAAIDLLQPYKTPAQGQATGTGFFINADGEIVTNAHVVDQARAIWIQIPSLGKQQIDVEIVGVSPERDLALLRVKPEGLKILRDELGEIPFLTLGDSDLVHRADEIMTLGYPLGQQGLKSTTGVVSGREQHLIQISAPINPGNSGGPSVNLNAEVIGINTSYIPDAQNVGYIIPINELKIILDDLHKVRLLRKPFLGVVFNQSSSAVAELLGNPQPGGLYVVEVYKDSPLHKAGVQKRDMIYEVNGHRLDIYGELPWDEEKISIVDYVSQLKLGQEVRIVVYRSGKRKEFTFSFDQSELLPIRKIYPGYEKIDYEIVAGMVVQPLVTNHLPMLVNVAPGLTKYAEMKYQVEPALIITHVFPDSQALRSRSLSPGGILEEVNGVKVKTLDDLRTALFKSIASGNVTIETADSIFVVFPLKKVLEEEKALSKAYFYSSTPGIKALMEKFAATSTQVTGTDIFNPVTTNAVVKIEEK